MEILMIKDGAVELAVNVDSLEEVSPYYPDHVLIERTGPEWVGWLWNGNIFLEPINTHKPNSRRITNLAFLNRFTDEEAITIDLASIGSTVQAAAMRRYQKKIDAAKFIDLDDINTQTGVKALESLGLLAIGRADIILNASITSEEAYY